MTDDIIIVHYTQHDGAGDTTLATNISRCLDADMYRVKPTRDDAILDIDARPKCVLLITAGGDAATIKRVFSSVAKTFPDAYRVYVECDRIDRRFKSFIRENVESYCHEYIHYSEYGEFNTIARHVTNTLLDVNVYQFGDHVVKPLHQRNGKVMIRGRFQGIKGTQHLYDVAEHTDFLAHPVFDTLSMCHEGVTMKVNPATRTFSAPIGMLSRLCVNTKTHELRSHVAIAPTPLAPHKLNVFGSYNADAVPAIANATTLLAPVHAHSRMKNNNRTLNKLTREAACWGRALEYVNTEAIDYGTPVLFSRQYLELYAPALLATDYWYDWLEEIPDRLEWLIGDNERFMNVVTLQRDIMHEKQTLINNTFVEYIRTLL